MTALFSPFDLAGTPLRNRVVMAPLTRARAPDDIASERVALYYAQRATAGLIVSEGTPISRQGQGYLFNPGIFSAAQIAGWKLTTESVHALGGRIFAQLWHVGRISHTSLLPEGEVPVAPSALQADAKTFTAKGFEQVSTPRALGIEEIPALIEDYRTAARNAIAAGFDGVEVHAANGYLRWQHREPPPPAV